MKQITRIKKLINAGGYPATNEEAIQLLFEWCVQEGERLEQLEKYVEGLEKRRADLSDTLHKFMKLTVEYIESENAKEKTDGKE